MCGGEVGDVVAAAVGAWLSMIRDGGIVGGEGEAAEVTVGCCRADFGGVARVGAGAFGRFGMEWAAVALGCDAPAAEVAADFQVSPVGRGLVTPATFVTAFGWRFVAPAGGGELCWLK
jgi:hypothetical protein